MRRVLLVSLLALGSTGLAAEVNVRFGNLAWVYARSGLPVVDTRGRVVAPVEETCALLGATCTPNVTEGTVAVQGAGTVPLAAGRTGFLELRPLAQALGLTVAWDARARVATVSGRWRSGGITEALDALSVGAGRLGSSVRLQVAVSPAQGPYRTLNLTSAEGTLGGLTLFSKLANGAINLTGDVRSSPDVRNAGPACEVSGQRCEVLIDREARYGLAVIVGR